MLTLNSQDYEKMEVKPSHQIRFDSIVIKRKNYQNISLVQKAVFKFYNYKKSISTSLKISEGEFIHQQSNGQEWKVKKINPDDRTIILTSGTQEITLKQKETIEMVTQRINKEG